MMTLKRVGLSALFCLALHAGAQEASLVERVQESKDLIQLMDNLSPDELQQVLQIPADDEEAVLEQIQNGGAVQIRVSISDQRIYVESPDGGFQAKVSTGRPGYNTVRGCFRPQRTHKMWYSQKYDNAPMPNAVFFHGGFAIHATYETKKLGRPASHGCVRVSMATSREIYRLVNTYGHSATSICVE